MASGEFWKVLKVLPSLEGGAVPTQTAVTGKGKDRRPAGLVAEGGEGTVEGPAGHTQNLFPSLRCKGFEDRHVTALEGTRWKESPWAP